MSALEPARGLLRRRVGALFHDPARGETPVQRRADAMFPPDSVAWRVHGDVVGMLVGGIASLLLQMLHPRVLAGVWDHSDFRADMHGRLRRTARFITVTTYASADEAAQTIARVRRIHAAVKGTLPDGTPYAADEPWLLAWVHVTEILSFLDGWIRYGQPDMPMAEQDAYVAEMARVGEALGADPLPRSRAGAEALIQRFRPELRVDHRTREVARLVLSQRLGPPLAAPASGMLMQAGVDLLPAWARRMHGLRGPLAAPAVRGGVAGAAALLRWAFEGAPYRQVAGATRSRS